MNEYFQCGSVGTIFDDYFIEIVVYLFEGMSMGVLMLFHFMNFKQGNPILSYDDSTSVIIGRSEFDTEEVIST